MMKDETRGIRLIVVAGFVIFHLSSFIFLKEARAQTPIYVGGGLAVGFNLHDLNLPVYRGDTLCGVFQSGTSILPSGFLTFEKPLGDPAHSFWIAPRLHLAGLGALLSTPAIDTARTRDPNDSANLIPVHRVHRMDASILSLGADLFVKYPVLKR